MSGRLSPAEAMTLEAVAPAIEIIDSRYANFQILLEDVVADNTSASGYVLVGAARNRHGQSGHGAGFQRTAGRNRLVRGHSRPSGPFAGRSRRFAAETGDELKPGYIVLAGAAAAAVVTGHLGLSVEDLGSVGFNVGRSPQHVRRPAGPRQLASPKAPQ